MDNYLNGESYSVKSIHTVFKNNHHANFSSKCPVTKVLDRHCLIYSRVMFSVTVVVKQLLRNSKQVLTN